MKLINTYSILRSNRIGIIPVASKNQSEIYAKIILLCWLTTPDRLFPNNTDSQPPNMDHLRDKTNVLQY